MNVCFILSNSAKKNFIWAKCVTLIGLSWFEVCQTLFLLITEWIIYIYYLIMTIWLYCWNMLLEKQTAQILVRSEYILYFVQSYLHVHGVKYLQNFILSQYFFAKFFTLFGSVIIIFL